MLRASGDLWNTGNVVLMCREIMLKNNKAVKLLLFTVIFLKELVLELTEHPSYTYIHRVQKKKVPLIFLL